MKKKDIDGQVQPVVMPDMAQGLELARCAYINLKNMERMMPTLSLHPLLPMVRAQVRGSIEALDPETGREFCDREDKA